MEHHSVLEDYNDGISHLELFSPCNLSIVSCLTFILLHTPVLVSTMYEQMAKHGICWSVFVYLIACYRKVNLFLLHPCLLWFWGPAITYWCAQLHCFVAVLTAFTKTQSHITLCALDLNLFLFHMQNKLSDTVWRKEMADDWWS